MHNENNKLLGNVNLCFLCQRDRQDLSFPTTRSTLCLCHRHNGVFHGVAAMESVLLCWLREWASAQNLLWPVTLVTCRFPLLPGHTVASGGFQSWPAQTGHPCSPEKGKSWLTTTLKVCVPNKQSIISSQGWHLVMHTGAAQERYVTQNWADVSPIKDSTHPLTCSPSTITLLLAERLTHVCKDAMLSVTGIWEELSVNFNRFYYLHKMKNHIAVKAGKRNIEIGTEWF